MARCYWDREAREWVEYDHLELRAQRARHAAGPFIVSDIPEYKSPLGTGIVSSRSQRREELKRHNCREVDPSEWKPGFYNRKYAQATGREWLGEKPVAKRLPTVVGPDVAAGEQ